MPEIVSGAEYATFINTFRCEPSNQDEVVQLNIDIVDRVASTFPGSSRPPSTAAPTARASSTTSNASPPNTSRKCNAHPSFRR